MKTKPKKIAIRKRIQLSETAPERFRIAPITIRLTEDKDGVVVPKKIQLFRTGTFKKLMPSGQSITFSITKETLSEIVENWKSRVRGQDIAVDFAHKSDEEAAAWIKNLYTEEFGDDTELFAEVEWTPDGYAAVAGKKFRYLSPDFAFGWTDNESGKKYGATLFGAGLTNRPVIKNMAPTVELTEVHEMAKETKELETLRLQLTEKDEEIKKLNLKLADNASDDDGDDGDEDDGGTSADKQDKKPKPKKELNMEELQAAYSKVCDELAEMKKSMAKSLAEQQTKEKETAFTLLLAEGKVVPAQKEAFMKNDMIKFTELAQSVKFETTGSHGGKVNNAKTSAQEEILVLAETAIKEGKATRTEAVSYVLSANPALNARYVQEMEGGEKPAEQ